VTDHGRHVVAFAGQRVVIEWRGSAAFPAIALLGGRSASGSAADQTTAGCLTARGSTPVTLNLTAVGNGDDTSFALEQGDIEIYRGSSLGAAAHHLLQHALHHLIDRSDGGLVLHAALVGIGAKGILLPGPSGSGKSMLAAWLANRGGQPLADEACFLSDSSGYLTPFERAFCFKGSWAEPLGLTDMVETFRNGDISIVTRDRISHDSIAADILSPRSAAPIVPRLLVFPRYQHYSSFTLSPIPPAQAAARLFESVANARNLADHGVTAVTGLVRSIPAFSLSYGHVDQLLPLEQLIARETRSL
jgi:hypothetical protein